jgi:hypothetical protein
LLVAEAGVHSHNQDLIHLRQNFLKDGRRSGWIDHHAGPFPKVLDPPDRAIEIIVAFPMNQ